MKVHRICYYLQECIGCEKKNCDLYRGTRFTCHEYSVEDKNLHDQFCYDCASGADESIMCPIHSASYLIDYEDSPIEKVLPKINLAQYLAKVEPMQQVKGVS